MVKIWARSEGHEGITVTTITNITTAIVMLTRKCSESVTGR